MPVFRLPIEHVFPPPHQAEPDGLLAIGGDLSPGRIIRAYASGIFPWFAQGDPILWWSPDPRLVLVPGEFHISHSVRPLIRKKEFQPAFDQNFYQVIRQCALVERKDQPGTWITSSMIRAYSRLHQMGIAHSAEVYRNGRLAGGLYGLCLGRIFFGESMFSLERDASKMALFYLTEELKNIGFALIDAQQSTPHLKSLGAKEIPRSEFLTILSENLHGGPGPGSWSGWAKPITHTEGQ